MRQAVYRQALRTRLLLLHFVLVALLPSTVVAQAAPLEGLDSYIERAMRDWNVPGFAIAVVRNDSIIHARGFGVRQLGRPEPVDEHTLFAIRSEERRVGKECSSRWWSK